MNRAVRSILLSALLCLGSGLTTAMPLAGGGEALPDIGSSAERALPLSQEQALGDAIMRQVRRELPVEEDPEIHDYINHLGFRLVANNGDARGHSFYFFVVKDPTINAFALPGGYVAVHTGLIAMTERESELAGVMGHEIAHVTQRHIARGIEAQRHASLPMLAGMLVGVLAMASGAGEAGMAAMAASQGGVQQSLLTNSRSNEAEADRVGIETLAAAGYDAFGVPEMFAKMQQASRYDRRPPEFLLTHPVTESRIADGRQRAALYPRGKDQEPQAFALFKARLADLETPDPNDLLKDYERKLKDHPRDVGARYGRALALTRLKRYDEAEPIIDELLHSDPGRIAYVLARARLSMAESKYADARALLEAQLNINPGNHPLTMTYAQVLLAMDDPQKARDVLQEHVYGYQNDVELYTLLADAQGRAGYLDEVYETQAERYFLLGDVEQAIRQLRQALRQRSSDPYARARIRARLAQIDEAFQKEHER